MPTNTTPHARHAAPFPLPHVSHRALARVTDRLEPPTQCHYCSGTVSLVSNAKVYGKEYGKWPYLYLCTGCGASVGLHPNTHLPLGTLANGETKAARKAGKAWFVRWVNGRMAGRDRRDFSAVRRTCYHDLADALGIPTSECHWAMFDADRARQAGEISRALFQRENKRRTAVNRRTG